MNQDTTLVVTDADVEAYQAEYEPTSRSAPSYERLTDDDRAEILRLAAKGWNQRQIAHVIGCSQPTISHCLQRFKTSQADVQALLRADAVALVSKWRKAADKAADRGDHRPAREALEAAYPELRPQPANTGIGGGVTVIVGTLERPCALPTLDIEAVRLSPAIAPGESEGDQNR